ncbi:uncharacterized protein LOC129183311 [Dunckerocampus dactyliophorus]|uniref:uncharacterized protein LOC129183311 n=1 Tax=Dunckerocampus dactyliophorus TaxID=161453 RepID=UPI0024075D5F|nr:uncharacterized protein LOC129183311 [Dunckerocampus dactyliophorus]
MLFEIHDAGVADQDVLFNLQHLAAYPSVLRRAELSPGTVFLYIEEAAKFVVYLCDIPPKHSRLKAQNVVVLIKYFNKMQTDLNRSMLGHQVSVKAIKQQRLIRREELARKKIPSLLDDIKNADPKDSVTKNRICGYLAAYLTCIYGHRTGVLKQMRVKEVEKAVGDDQTGYLVSVLDHKTTPKYGLAQIYLDPDEFEWFRRWLKLRSRSVPTNHFFFFLARWVEGKPRIWSHISGRHGLRWACKDSRSAVATCNFEDNDPVNREMVSSFMCHNINTEERFHVMHKNLRYAKNMREIFIKLSMRREEGPMAATDVQPSNSGVVAPKSMRHSSSDEEETAQKGEVFVAFQGVGVQSQHLIHAVPS